MKFLKNYTALVNTGKTILLCWVPGHVGIRGNEQVDDVAKVALHSSISAVKYPPIDLYHDMTALCYKFWQADWNQRAGNKLQYNCRVLEIEHGSFTLLVFSSYGGCSCSPETDRFIKELSTKLAEKHCTDLGTTKNWLRTKLSFNLIRSAVLCIRESRSIRSQTHTVDPTNVNISREMVAGIVSKTAIVFYITVLFKNFLPE